MYVCILETDESLKLDILTTPNISKKNDTTQDHCSIKASADKEDDETFDIKPVLQLFSETRKSAEKSEYDFSRKCAEKQDMEQTGCLSRENQESSFTIRKILREQQRGKHTHPKVNITSRFSPYTLDTGKCDS